MPALSRSISAQVSSGDQLRVSESCRKTRSAMAGFSHADHQVNQRGSSIIEAVMVGGSEPESRRCI